jgi:hypothetical protein
MPPNETRGCRAALSGVAATGVGRAMPLSRVRTGGGQFGLRLDDGPMPGVCLLRDGHGGITFADVVRDTDANDPFVQKELGERHVADFVVEVASLASSGLFEWVAASWAAAPPTRDGALLACTSTYTIALERSFDDALIAETVMPALDAAAKSPAVLTVRFVAASSTGTVNPGGKLVIPLGKGNVKLWLTSNFRLEIDGLDCTKVSRIDPFTVRRAIEPAGGSGDGFVAGPIDFPDLRIFVSASSIQSWDAWYQDFIVDGLDSDSAERTGAIRFLAPDLKAELARIELTGLGIHRLEPEEDDGGSAQIPRYVADLYCEQMTLIPGGAP